MEPVRQLNRGEQEVATAASRLVELVEEALTVAPQRSSRELDSLKSLADRIERASRDLSVALRELAREGRIAREAAE
jgi:CRISPR/Cas system-associated protein Csm6